MRRLFAQKGMHDQKSMWLPVLRAALQRVQSHRQVLEIRRVRVRQAKEVPVRLQRLPEGRVLSFGALHVHARRRRRGGQG